MLSGPGLNVPVVPVVAWRHTPALIMMCRGAVPPPPYPTLRRKLASGPRGSIMHHAGLGARGSIPLIQCFYTAPPPPHTAP